MIDTEGKTIPFANADGELETQAPEGEPTEAPTEQEEGIPHVETEADVESK
jgi:hypothetical protein